MAENWKFSRVKMEIAPNKKMEAGVITVPSPKLGDNLLLDQKEVILLLTGWGSGWTGIIPLGYHLAQKTGFTIIMPSLYGYGNSSDLDYPLCVGGACFDNEVEALLEMLDYLQHHFPQIDLRDKVHFVGHSMGALVGIHLAKSFPLETLTLLSPAGFHRRTALGLALRFVSNGLAHAIWNGLFGRVQIDMLNVENEGVAIYEKPPQEKSAFGLKRLHQRWLEFRGICKVNPRDIRQDLRKLNLYKEGRILCLVGSWDWVFPISRKVIQNSRLAGMEAMKLGRTFHNLTVYKSQVVAKIIANFIRRIRNDE